MVLQILRHTPEWVWTVLVLLIALGLSQTKTRRVSFTRAAIVPWLFIALSAGGVLASFGPAPALLEWLAGVVLAVLVLGKLVGVRGARWSPADGEFTVPGSAVPLVLMVGMFLLRYAVGIALAFDPQRAHDAAFAGACALAYGSFAGLFWARARSLRRYARADDGRVEVSGRRA